MDDGGVFDLLTCGVLYLDDAGEVIFIGVVDLHSGLIETFWNGKISG